TIARTRAIHRARAERNRIETLAAIVGPGSIGGCRRRRERRTPRSVWSSNADTSGVAHNPTLDRAPAGHGALASRIRTVALDAIVGPRRGRGGRGGRGWRQGGAPASQAHRAADAHTPRRAHSIRRRLAHPLALAALRGLGRDRERVGSDEDVE